jgi:hypothetical protein
MLAARLIMQVEKSGPRLAPMKAMTRFWCTHFPIDFPGQAVVFNSFSLDFSDIHPKIG